MTRIVLNITNQNIWNVLCTRHKSGFSKLIIDAIASLMTYQISKVLPAQNLKICIHIGLVF